MPVGELTLFRQIQMHRFILFTAIFVTLARASANEEAWKVKGYMYCVGYTYECTKDPRGYSIIFKDGSIHRGVIRSLTLRLNERQTEQLFDRLNTTKEDQEQCECHEPNHAFVFYDAGWKPVGWVTLSFLCQNTGASPKGLPLGVDMERLKKYCKRIGMPIFPDEKGYSVLYQNEQAEQAGADQPATAGESNPEGKNKPQPESEATPR